MANTTTYQLYHKEYCPYCRKVRSAMQKMNLHIPLVDVGRDIEAWDELNQKGGKGMVPCLRMEKPDDSVEWMYESDDIIHFLRNEFG